MDLTKETIKRIKRSFIIVIIILITSLSFAMTREEKIERTLQGKTFRRVKKALDSHLFDEVSEELSYNIDVNYINKQGKTLLHAVCGGIADNIEAVKYLVEAGIDIEAELNNGKTAIMLAIMQGHDNIVRYLLENNARVDAHSQEYNVRRIDDPLLRQILIDEGCKPDDEEYD